MMPSWKDVRTPICGYGTAEITQVANFFIAPDLMTAVDLQFAVKMVTDDGDMTTDIVVEGDVEEIERFCKVCSLTWIWCQSVRDL